ncbi:MAG: NADPH-dependent F420 reductase [Betaproteobacteria bacterium]
MRKCALDRHRRALMAGAGALLLASALPVAGQDQRALKIGIIGSGRIGSALGEFWVRAGHEVMFSDLSVEDVKALLGRLKLGPRARAGTSREAAAFGDAVLISVPYKALPGIGRELAAELKGKVVLDTGNPYPGRDGDMALAARAKGTGVASAEYLPGVRLVRAFNSVRDMHLRSESHRKGAKVAIPLAADDAEAMTLAMRLVADAGFEPVPVGPLARAREFDVDTRAYGFALTARELRRELGLKH